ncbi:MAG TPA: galactokinase family protein [Gemmatimonadales bacterium]|nr:galactokinase family protein [Gemmatimonadales bacterium]
MSADVPHAPSASRAALALFARSFRGRPRSAASAPGRVNLIGEHLDYNGGPVLPMAVARRTAVVAAPGRFFEAVTARDGVVDRFDPAGPMRGAWTDYLAGVVRALERRGVRLPGASLAVASTVPEGGGLSSSAAPTVAAARALAALSRARLGAEVLAEVAWEAEHEEVGVRCGRMDQVIAALAAPGKALLYDTGTGARRAIPFRGKLWLVDTGVRHRLTDGGYNQRRGECEEALRALRAQGWSLPSLAAYPLDRLPPELPPNLARRATHVVTESERVRHAAAALAARDLRTLGRLMTESHLSLRDRFEASCEEADVLVEAAGRLGAYGARLTGAGWGGTVIVLLPERDAARVIVELQQQFGRIYGRIPEAWSTGASSGVKREPLPGRS